MIAQQWGRMPSVRTTVNLTLPAYKRLAMQGGIIADGLGTGKTVMCLSFILFTSIHANTIRGPTLILAPSALILYAWMDEVEKNWPGLKGYLYHGRHDGQIGKDYENLRILAEDIEVENGQITKVTNKWHFLFDPEQWESQKVRQSIVFATYQSFTSRAKVEERDDDDDIIISNAFLESLVSLLQTKAMSCATPGSLRWKVCKALEGQSQWIVTGTPMLNREINAHGLISFLWRQEWEVSPNITKARMEFLTDLIYIHLASLLHGLRLKVAILHASVSLSKRARIQKAFVNPEDDSIQFLLVSMKLGATGIDRLQNDCSWMVIVEPSLKFNTVLQMIARLYRTGQQHIVHVFLLFLKDSIESYLWGKFQYKMSAEIVEWTTGEELSTEDLKKGSDLIVNRMFGADEDLARVNPHGRY